jgi:hypothetical protein
MASMTTIPVSYTTEDRVVASIRALKGAQRRSTDDLFRHLGISRTTWYERMKSGQFTIGEIAALADFFGVTVQEMVDGMGLKGTAAYLAPYLELIEGEGRKPGGDTPLLMPIP